jgi:hypothetical protein
MMHNVGAASRALSYARKTPFGDNPKREFHPLGCGAERICKNILFSKGEYENDSSRKAGNY